MSDSDADRAGERRPPPLLTPDAERGVVERAKFGELRALLGGQERREIVPVKPPPADRQARTLEVSEVLPDAISQGSGDPHLVRALGPAVEQAITASARKDPGPLADALLPVFRRALRKSLTQALAPLITLGCAVLLVAGVWTFQAVRSRQQWNDYLDRLSAEPGIVVTQNGRRNGRYFVAGLRDELAADPLRLLASSNLPPGSVDSRWEPYQSLHPSFVLQRARAVLRPPPNVILDYRDGILTATGLAPANWVSESRLIAGALAGVHRFEYSAGATVEITPAPLGPPIPEQIGPTPTPTEPTPAETASTPAPTESAPTKAELPRTKTEPTTAKPESTPTKPDPALTKTAPTPTKTAPTTEQIDSIPENEAKPARSLPRPVGASPELSLMEQIEVITLVFQSERELAPGQEATVRRLDSLFRELNEIVYARGVRAQVAFVGHTGGNASTSSLDLAKARALRAIALVRTQKFDSVALVATADTSPADVATRADGDDDRHVSFRVRLFALD